jgi:splicing factor U2AF 35 kDa subunit
MANEESSSSRCSFFQKVGACRHGDACTRTHFRPSSSTIVLLKNFYKVPAVAAKISEGTVDFTDDEYLQAQSHLESFYREFFLDVLNVTDFTEIKFIDNLNEHLIGSVFVKFPSEKNAEKFHANYIKKFPGQIEFSPLSDFREAKCKQFEENECARGAFCNFLHFKHIPRAVTRKLEKTSKSLVEIDDSEL